MATRISIAAIRAAVERMPASQRAIAQWSDRYYARSGGFDAFVRDRVRTVGDVRMMMDDQLDQLVSGLPATEAIIIEVER